MYHQQQPTKIVYYIVHTFVNEKLTWFFLSLFIKYILIKIFNNSQNKNLNKLGLKHIYIQYNRKIILPSIGAFSKGFFNPKLFNHSFSCYSLINLFFSLLHTEPWAEVIAFSLFVCEIVRVL